MSQVHNEKQAILGYLNSRFYPTLVGLENFMLAGKSLKLIIILA
jgi:hypothetical protein